MLWHITPLYFFGSNISTLIGSFCAKYITFDLKKYRRVMKRSTEAWCNIWRKTVLRFEKYREEFGKYLPEHSKVSKLVVSWDPFIQSRKCVSLKYTDNLCHNNEKWCRIGRAIDFVFQNWYEKFDKIWSKYSNVSKFALGLLLNKVYNVWAEKV